MDSSIHTIVLKYFMFEVHQLKQLMQIIYFPDFHNLTLSFYKKWRCL